MRGLFFAATSLLALGVSAFPAEVEARQVSPPPPPPTPSPPAPPPAPPAPGVTTKTVTVTATATAGSNCLPTAVATALANGFRDLIGEKFNKTLAKQVLTPTFHDYSDSVLELINAGCPNGKNLIPYGTPGFSNRTQFIDGQSTQKPINFNIEQIWPACNSVAFRWYSSSTGSVTPEEQVTGIIVLEAAPTLMKPAAAGPFTWQVQNTYSEFNSGAWLYNLGIFVPPQCPPSPPS